MRYRPAQPAPNSLLLAGMLMAMVFFLSLLPKLVFAADEADPLPRYTLSPKQVGQNVAKAIAESGVAELVEAQIDLDDPHTIYGSDEPMEAQVSGLNADTRNKRWSANIVFRNGEKVLSVLPMQGKFQAMIELPSLTKAYRGGEVISKDDVEVKSYPIHYSRSDVLTSADSLVGKAARRNISADRPVREHEVSAPIVVKKNDIVSMNFNNNNIHISTTGQVLADAAVGDMVEVKNSNSNHVVRAVVKDSRTVSVLPFVQTSALGGNDAAIN